MALLDKESMVGYRWKDFQKNYLKLNPKYTIVHDEKNNIHYGFKKGTKVAHWKYFDDKGELYIDDKMVARKVMTGKADKNIFEDIGITPIDKTIIKKHTSVSNPPYDPDAHLDRRDKDEEKLKALLTDLIKSELKKLSKK